MSEFSGYEKMANSLKKLSLNESDFSKMEKLKWVVTEKVHGANFSFVYENQTVRFAKRKEYLSWNDDFFGFQLVVSKIEDKIVRLFEDLSRRNSGGKIIVYGELFGGKYPHPDIEPDIDLNAIQTGVYYCPSIEFCAFDIAIEQDGTGSKYYMDYETAIAYFEKHQLLYAKPLLVGKFNDAINFNTRINSTLPELFHLPGLAENMIEGIVIKPFNYREDVGLFSRPILKLKNKEFDEENKFHQAEKWSYIPKVSSKTEDLSFIVDELRNYVTKNRLESAISKIGPLDFSNEKRLKNIEQEFTQDALEDFNENNDSIWEELPPSDQKWIMERIHSEVKKLIYNQHNKSPY